MKKHILSAVYLATLLVLSFPGNAHSIEIDPSVSISPCDVRAFSDTIDLDAGDGVPSGRSCGGGGPAPQPIEVCGHITQDAYWFRGTAPFYKVTCDVIVDPGVTLHVHFGTQVRFAGPYKIDVQGTLEAQGYAPSYIFFTRDSSFSGNWQYIQLSDTSTLSGAIVSYADEGVRIDGTSPTVTNNYFRYNTKGAALYNNAVPVFTGNTINNNAVGVFLSGSAANFPLGPISNNSILNNTTYNMQVEGGSSALTVNAENNWWGTVDPIVIAQKIFDKVDNSALPLVDFSPVLDSPGGQSYAPISFGDSVTANISTVTEVDKYIFTANGGDILEIPFARVGGISSFDLRMRVFDSAGVQVASIDTTADFGILSANIPATGNYTLWVSERDSNTTGTYAFTLQRRNNPGRSTVINYGNAVSGDINPVAELNVYKFSGEMGDQLFIPFSDTVGGANFSLRVRVYDINGIQLANTTVSPLTLQLPATGDYTIWISETDYDATGNYSLGLQRLNNPVGVIPFNYGNAVNGSITPEAEMDVYQFHGQAGDRIVLPFSRTGGFATYSVQARVYDINGVQLANTTVSPLTLQLPATGDYTIWINDINYDATGNYSVSLQQANNPGGAVPISFGQTKTGPLSIPAQVDIFTFSAQADDHIVIPFQKTAGLANFSVQVDLYDANGVQVAATTASPLTVQLTSDGPYTIWVHDAGFNADGGYSLTLMENLITGITNTPQFINPQASETAAINFILDRPSNVTVKLYQASLEDGSFQRTLIHTLVDNQAMPVGPHTVVWDGRNAKSQILEASVYIFTIYVDGGDRVVDYDPAFVSTSVPIQNNTLTPSNFNPYAGGVAVVNYNLTAPAWLRLRTGIFNQQSPVRTLIDYAPRNAGPSFEEWDGRNDNGIIVPAANYIAAAWTTKIPGNTIIIEPSTLTVTGVQTNPYAIVPVYGDGTTITYSLNEGTDVTIRIISSSGNVLRTLIENQSQSTGMHTIFWNGKDDLGRVITTPGAYRIQVEAVNGAGGIIEKQGTITILP